MRVVGNQERSDIEPDPIKAFHRGLALDAMMHGLLPPVERGVTRGTHAYFNRLDDARQTRAARALNAT